MVNYSNKVESYAVGLTHFHKVHDLVYARVESLVRSIVVKYVNGQRRVQINVNADLAQCLYDFIDEMKFGYMHPRSTSARMIMPQGHAFC